MKEVVEALDLPENKGMNRGVVRLLAALGVVLAVALFVVVVFNMPGWLASFLRGLLGYSAYLLPCFIAAHSFLLLFSRHKLREKSFTVLFCFIGAMLLVSAVYNPPEGAAWYASGERLNSGGFIGELVAKVLSLGLGNNFVFVVSFLMFLLAGLFVVNPNALAFANVSYETEKNRNIIAMLSDYNELGKRKIKNKNLAPGEDEEFRFVLNAPEGAEPAVPERKAAKRKAPYVPARPQPIRRPAVADEPYYQTDTDGFIYIEDDFIGVDDTEMHGKKSGFKVPMLGRFKETVKMSFSKRSADKEKAEIEREERDRTEGEKAERDRFERESAERESTEREGLKESDKSQSGAADSSGAGTEAKAVAGGSKKIDNLTQIGMPGVAPNKNKPVSGSEDKKHRNNQQYSVPPEILLDEVKKNTGNNREYINATMAKLQKVLEDFDIDATVVGYEEGPSITMYEISLGVGVKISKLQNLSDDIALNLAAPSVRIAPVAGKTTVGLEVPNKTSASVSIREVIETREFGLQKSPLAVAIGKDVSGKPVIGELSSMPHLLVAGATGSGKSVCINSMILSILLSATPEDVRFIMIDPKHVELGNYNGVPHLLMPVVNDPKQAASALDWVVQEMEDRYARLFEKNVKDFKAYNKKVGRAEKMPYIVVIVDELADLMMVASKQVEESICRIAQKARAAGIHLVLATQRPSVDVITGLIKANIPSRIAFMVSSQVDSRTILDAAGAEKLLGKGDMLYHPVSISKPKRVQGVFVSTHEIDEVVNFIKAQNYETDKVDMSEVKNVVSQIKEDEEDEFLEEAIALVRAEDKASASMLQRRFQIGYNRAARLIDTMEEMGIVGPSRGSKPREVLR